MIGFSFSTGENDDCEVHFFRKLGVVEDLEIERDSDKLSDMYKYWCIWKNEGFPLKLSD